MNTQCHDGTMRSNCVARMGAKPRPSSENMLSWRPWLKPRREGRDASPVAATLAGVNAPSATPITARISIKLANPEARPDKLDSSENATIETTRIFLRPIRSDTEPIAIAQMPQATLRMPIRLPSC